MHWPTQSERMQGAESAELEHTQGQLGNAPMKLHLAVLLAVLVGSPRRQQRRRRIRWLHERGAQIEV